MQPSAAQLVAVARELATCFAAALELLKNDEGLLFC